jgi:hypothetical protein
LTPAPDITPATLPARTADAGVPARVGSPRVLALAALAVPLAAGMFLHVERLNGPAYWRWPWRAPAVGPLALRVAVALVPAAIGIILRARGRLGPRRALQLAAGTLLLVQLVLLGSQTTPFSLLRIAELVASPSVTSYFTDGWRLADGGSLDWIAAYPDTYATLTFHSLTKPPGPVLYYWVLVRLVGPAAAATVGGLLLAFAAAGVVPATAWLTRALTGDRTAGAEGATFVALSAGLAVFLPELDQAYPLLACGVLGLWAIAVREDRSWHAAGSGLLLAFACFFSYAFLVLGAFLVVYTLLALRARGAPISAAARPFAAAAAAFTAFYAATGLLLGFDPLATLAGALENQRRILEQVPRPFPATVLFDLTDFAMGLSWVGAVLAGLGAARRDQTPWRWLGAACLGQLAIVAATGLLAGETIRVWLFMVPLAAVPIDRELSRWSAPARGLAFACTAALTFAIARNLLFVG